MNKRKWKRDGRKFDRRLGKMIRKSKLKVVQVGE